MEEPHTLEELHTLSTREAARYVNLAAQTLHNKRCRGEGPPYVKLGSRILYLRSDLDRWLDEHRVEPVRNR